MPKQSGIITHEPKNAMKKLLLMLLAAGAFSFAAVSCDSKTENAQEEQAEEAEEAADDADNPAAEDAAEATQDSIDAVDPQ
jgi:hypothetical protein